MKRRSFLTVLALFVASLTNTKTTQARQTEEVEIISIGNEVYCFRLPDKQSITFGDYDLKFAKALDSFLSQHPGLEVATTVSTFESKGFNTCYTVCFKNKRS